MNSDQAGPSDQGRQHSTLSSLPWKPIDRVVGPLARFLHVEAASGVVLLICTVLALALANSPFAATFLGFWKTRLVVEFGAFHFDQSLKHVINDGLMAVFFFVVGLEVKRELVIGELREFRRAALPIAAAFGGMIAPAAIYLACQAGQAGQRGWGIPMATDIAFVVGCLALLGRRIPHGLRITLLSLAIVDDIGAILVIAVGYTETIHFVWLGAGLVGLGLVAAAARLGIRSFAVYTVIGVVVWYAFHESGIHATIAGVILGLMTPARNYLSQGMFGDILARAEQIFHGGEWESTAHRAERLRRFSWAARETISPLEYLEETLHPWVGFLIMPVFALANAGVPIQVADVGSPVSLAVVLGLVLGKPLGILAMIWLTVRMNLARLPDRVSWGMMAAGGCLAGIGFTMALFIADLALQQRVELLNQAKVGILVGSAISAAAGMGLLVAAIRPRIGNSKTNDE